VTPPASGSPFPLPGLFTPVLAPTPSRQPH
jgi:hypothetical protein